MNEFLEESQRLYNEIDKCIEDLVYSRLKRDEGMEKMAISKMERLLVGTQQHLSWILGSVQVRVAKPIEPWPGKDDGTTCFSLLEVNPEISIPSDSSEGIEILVKEKYVFPKEKP